jgi:hypothetical protein
VTPTIQNEEIAMRDTRKPPRPAALCFALLLASVATVVAGEPPKPASEPPQGLVLYYSFDQSTSDGGIPDRSGANNHGKATGTRWLPAGKQGGGLALGGGQFIHVANCDSLNLKQGTIAVWFRTSRADAVFRRIVDKRAEQGYALAIGGDALGLQARGKLAFGVNGKFCLSDSPVVDDLWHHAAATYDGENLRLYVDGRPQKRVVAYKGEIAANADDLTIGLNRSNPASAEKNQSFDGSLDEVMIFNRALSADEIKALVAAVDPSAGKPKFSKQQVAGRLKQLKLLFEDGLITEDFYARKVEECRAAE